VDFVSPLGPDDLLMVLVSGGTSSLLTLPAPGLDLSALARTSDVLLRAGATIDEMNTVRKHLSSIKGGNLARLAAPAQVIGLILSDVPGNNLGTIGSGPTAPDGTTFAEARAVLDGLGVTTRVPPEVVEYLSDGIRGVRGETVKPGDPVLERISNIVVGSNELATAAALRSAESLGFQSKLKVQTLRGEARIAGRRIASDVRAAALARTATDTPACWVYGGETTVVVTGDGTGGRNQELALAAAIELSGVDGVAIVAFATDGIDGPTDAAGAVVTGATLDRATRLGLDAAHCLENNDTYTLFDTLGDLLLTGPTGTNVADLVLVFMWSTETSE
jgi:hydroxypyruvate reductase